MNISQLIEILEAVKVHSPDAKVLAKTDIGTLVECNQVGIVRVIPIVPRSDADKRPYPILSGHEWRVPVTSKDEPEIEREIHFKVGL